jgi:HK97 gp10 family phage protein
VISMKFDAAAVDAALDKIASEAGKVRPAAQAGAQVLYEEARARVPVSAKGHWFHGTSFRKTGQKYWFDAGSLRASIYQVYSEDNSSEQRAEYHVSWNRLKAPYAWMVEYGTSRAGARPFLRPAYDAKVKEAMEAAKARWSADVRAALAGVVA